VEFLNYHHLRYFWKVAQEGSLRKAADKLHVSQPTISAQLADLEAALGEKLFRRSATGLTLTETGQLAFSYAEEIFGLGQEFVHVLKQRPTRRPMRVHIGIADSLPKLVCHQIIRPVFQLPQPAQPVCVEGKTADLLAQMAVYRLDLVLADEAAPSSLPVKAFNHRLGDCGITFCATPQFAKVLKGGFPKFLDGAPMLLPTSSTALRRSLENWFQSRGIYPRIIAEYDDPGLMKAAAADGLGCFPLPSVAIQEAVTFYGFKILGSTQDCREQFYAISAERKLTHPAVIAISSNAQAVLFAAAQNKHPLPDPTFSLRHKGVP
jgi:LysR family transcriptional regulator, transcriptional activator of nhaA